LAASQACIRPWRWEAPPEDEDEEDHGKLQGPLGPSHTTPTTRQFTTLIPITLLQFIMSHIIQVAVSPARVFVLIYMQRVTNADSKKKRLRVFATLRTFVTNFGCCDYSITRHGVLTGRRLSDVLEMLHVCMHFFPSRSVGSHKLLPKWPKLL
jgi:hypothetical protein